MRYALALLVLVAFSCTSGDRAYRTLQVAGYREIELTGWAPSRCGEHDGTCTGFIALGPTGKVAEGAVGCAYTEGCGKGCTIRLY